MCDTRRKKQMLEISTASTKLLRKQGFKKEYKFLETFFNFSGEYIAFKK
jgi:hypothetical protein